MDMGAQEGRIETGGITIETQPHFINVVQGGKNVLINTSMIKKIEPVDRGEIILTLTDNEKLRLPCSIEDFVKVLQNVTPLDIE